MEQITYWGNCVFQLDNILSGQHHHLPDAYGALEMPWELVPTSDRGLIAIARKAFKVGDFLCAERPATFVKGLVICY